MNITAKEVSTIPQLGHRQAMALAAAEYDRFVAAVDALAADDWDRPTDNDQWDVKAMVAHGRPSAPGRCSRRACSQQWRPASRQYHPELEAMPVRGPGRCR